MPASQGAKIAATIDQKIKDRPKSIHEVSPLSKEIVIGLVGYAGAGCSTVGERLEALLSTAGYSVSSIKLSNLIQARAPDGSIPPVVDGATKKGITKFKRAVALQDEGDKFRQTHGAHAVASLAIKEIIDKRGQANHGEQQLAFVLDSIKHRDEVDLLRRVYDKSFRLVAVHCERTKREGRLIGSISSSAKYKGAPEKDVIEYMNRDEKDPRNDFGQQVRDAFYLGDYFIDNNAPTADGLRLVEDLQRFVNLILGNELVRPTKQEEGMFHAQAAALASACLSRQVGAALQTADGTIASTGTNDVPSYGGGVCGPSHKPKNRCFAWDWKDIETGATFKGCHNTRKKNELRKKIAKWLAAELSEPLAAIAHPRPSEGTDTANAARKKATTDIKSFLESKEEFFEGMPVVGDLIEYSRSIHAEMDAVFSAARHGSLPKGGTLYCTTFPCHNCARHLITAGVAKVYYIEPYVKSLAHELHSDAIQTEMPPLKSDGSEPEVDKLLIVPFTGVGPRMYEDHFIKRSELKDAAGNFSSPRGGTPAYAVRLRELASVEEAAAGLVTDQR